jgi:ketosteroid isomerase-like protein
MAQENVEVVRQMLWAFENDADAFESLLSPDGVWFPFEDNHSPTHGIDGAMKTRRRWLDAWDEVRTDLEDVAAKDENVVASVHMIGRGKASGVEVDVRIHFHFKVRDGKVVYTFEHLDKAQALEAAGLSE